MLAGCLGRGVHLVAGLTDTELYVRGRIGAVLSTVLSELVVGITGRISSRQSTAEQRPGVLGGALLAPEESVWEDRPREKTLPTRPGRQG